LRRAFAPGVLTPLPLFSLLSLPTGDRRLLRRTILPWFAARTEFARVLFVGCAWYTRGYEAFFRGKQYWTMDSDPCKRRWGARRHVCASLTRIREHFRPGALDLIVCNGVFGWGLDAKPDVEEAFSGCRDCLRDGGVLVLGWNDIPARRPFPLEQCAGLRLLRPYVFEPVRSARLETGTRNRHVYDFYVK
jgi:SAM-dependent methyltransferase